MKTFPYFFCVCFLIHFDFDDADLDLITLMIFLLFENCTKNALRREDWKIE